MLLWLQYLRYLELAGAAAGHREALGVLDYVKTMCEDEEWGNESETMQGDVHTPSSPEPRPASAAASPAASESSAPPASPASSPPAPSPAPTPTPRLRLNASLATDPALAPSAAAIKSEPEEIATSKPPALAPRDYLAALPSALTSAIAAGLFPPPPARDADRPQPPTVPVYMCAPCGIRYSSPSTLEAHRTYYCSHRPGKPSPDDDKSADGADDAGSESSAKTPRVSKQYACTHCSYSADKKVSLNRHMRMHSSSPSPPSAPPSLHSNGDASLDAASPALASDRYCTDCDIRFSSMKTFRAHKTHYCSTRQVMKQTPSSARSGSSCTSGSAPPSPNEQRVTPPASSAGPQQPFLALPTSPILIVPYSLFRGASVLSGSTVAGLPEQDAPCFLLPNGTIQPMTRAFHAVDAKESEVLKSANRPRDGQSTRDSIAPLDLSVRRTPESGSAAGGESDEHEKENRLRRSATPEQIVCAPSLPASPATPSPSPRRSLSPNAGESSPKRRRRESRGATPKPNGEDSSEEKYPPSLHPLLLRGGVPLLPPELAMRLAEMPPLPAPPQVLVKQGQSKCKQCNIVFCKYENYLVHKRLYCSNRGREDDGGAASPAPSPDAAPHYQQLICVACGIKFNSMDNLVAHQSYYCTKRETRSPRAAPAQPTPEPERPRCTKCKGSHSPGRPCSVREGLANAGEPGGWKCPCCDVVSATAQAAQRHMEAHAGVKAFRCTICRYKGNTLRGMRTHIRMHFPKKPQDLQEESYISCVVEEEGVPRESTSPAAAAAGGGGAGAERVHRCNSCAYSSTYRGNVVRHARLVHPLRDPEPVEVEAEPQPVIKKEPEDPSEVTLTVGPGPNYCKSCDISFKYINTFIAHKKHYCSSHAAEGAGAQANNNVPGRVSEASAPVQ